MLGKEYALMRQTKHRHRESTDREHAKSRDSEEIYLGLGRAPKTELGRLLLAARREFFAREGRFLDRDEIEREVRERRGDLSEAAGS
jgi:hypothetical protein